MQGNILAQGVLPLTQQAADASLDAIDFIAAAVRGYDAIEVTNIVRPIWRAHLAHWYPHLPPGAQLWFANAPQGLAFVRAQWPLLDLVSRGALLYQWSIQLPMLLGMVEPVLAQAQAQATDIDEAVRRQFDDIRHSATGGQSTAANDEPPVTGSESYPQVSTDWNGFNDRMTAATTDMMRAMSRNPWGRS